MLDSITQQCNLSFQDIFFSIKSERTTTALHIIEISKLSTTVNNDLFKSTFNNYQSDKQTVNPSLNSHTSNIIDLLSVLDELSP